MAGSHTVAAGNRLKGPPGEIGYSLRDPDKLRRFAEEEAELRTRRGS